MTHQSISKSYDVGPMPRQDSSVILRRLIVLAGDLAVVFTAFVVAFLFRFEFVLDQARWDTVASTWPYVLAAYALCSHYFGLNRGLRHYASFGDIVNIAKAVGAAGLLAGMAILFVTQGRFPRSVLLLTPILSMFGVCLVHAAVRYAKDSFPWRSEESRPERTAIIVGAGDMGELVYRQMRSHPDIFYRIVAFCDDDPRKWGMRLHGVPVVGAVKSLGALLGRKPVDEVIVALDGRRGTVVAAVAEALRGLEVRPEIKIVPTLEEMLRSPISGAQPRKVKPLDLLNRKEVRLDSARIARSIEGKVVLVTGAGGTIGGELSRQIAAYRPRAVLLLENHATALFYRESEIREKAPGVPVVGLLGDVRDQALLERVFKTYRPQAVFHAAAHKHVFQLETNIQEGVSNNVLGTYHLAAMAERHGVETFLLISTDKAVRPSCVMGASKRAAEVVVTDFAHRGKTRFCAVRFGNVLGSSGSVLKIFQEQIELGQPITITHKDATRYFMTVEEAVGLVLQSSAMARGGEVFVLKMGEPVRILDMARSLILLSGLEPGRDIDIRITGLKPGEKLTEELAEDPAGQEPSEHSDVTILRAENKPVDDLAARVLELDLASRGGDTRACLRMLADFVPTYTADPLHDDAAESAL